MFTWTESAYLLAGIALVPLFKLLVFRRSIYNDTRDVIALNASAPRTRWFNLGLWKSEGITFPEAAAELCLEIARRAELSRGGRVLEVGSGYGDSALLLCRTFPSISFYLGVANLPSQIFSSTAMAEEHGLKAQFTLGDATTETELLAPRSVDAIIAVDCAYHFQRDRWLRSAHRALDHGGRLALTDLLLPRTPTLLDSLSLRFICMMAGLPFANLMSRERYEATLREQGWAEVQLEDISASVYPGFLRFIKEHGEAMGPALSAWGGLAGYARVVEWYSTPERPRLAFYIISARKRGP